MSSASGARYESLVNKCVNLITEEKLKESNSNAISLGKKFEELFQSQYESNEAAFLGKTIIIFFSKKKKREIIIITSCDWCGVSSHTNTSKRASITNCFVSLIRVGSANYGNIVLGYIFFR